MNEDEQTMSDEQVRFLSMMPRLARIPSDWEDQRFYTVDIDQGRRVLCLAYDAEQAERAVLVWFGRVSCPRFVEGDDGQPLARETPMLGLAGPVQYLDATLVTEGDPAVTPWRAPDSSPALTPCAGLALDAGGGRHYASAEIDRQERTRDAFLARRGLLAQETI